MPPESESGLNAPWEWWAAFLAFVACMLGLDLGVFHRKSHAVTFREAAVWTFVWIGLALVFGGWVWWQAGPVIGLQYLTGYVVEKALSMDNVFVFLVIFRYFQVPAAYQHRVLFYGILGALVMRAAFIFAGVALLAAFHWVIYVFGAFLIFTGIKTLFVSEKKIDPERNPVIRALKRAMPVTEDFVGDRFTVRRGGRLFITPLLVTLVFVEMSDVIFAVDSIPAVLAITTDPFVVFTSNVFAILGLRSLYFCLSRAMDGLRYLGTGLAMVLIFIGGKMVTHELGFKLGVGTSLAVIAGILGIAVVASALATRRDAAAASADEDAGKPTVPPPS